MMWRPVGKLSGPPFDCDRGRGTEGPRNKHFNRFFCMGGSKQTSGAQAALGAVVEEQLGPSEDCWKWQPSNQCLGRAQGSERWVRVQPWVADTHMSFS
jgi:hypothetical protein